MRTRCWALVALCVFFGCDDEVVAADGGAGGEGGTGGVPPPIDVGAGGGGGLDMNVGPNPDMRVGPNPDMRVGPNPDMRVGPNPDMFAGPVGDVGPLDGDPCDPRELARACTPGQFCVHVPGAQEHVGRCQQGDGCDPLTGAGCDDPNRPYCHLRGGGTFCTAPGQLRQGEDCVDERSGIPQACVDGQVCNNSVCQPPCAPGQENDCPDGGRCADISEATGVATAGLCAPRGCNWFNGEGCPDGQKCTYAIRNDGVVVGSCFDLAGMNQAGAPCGGAVGGGDNCAQGLLCIGPPNGERICRVLCDTAGYEAACPEFQVCREALVTQRGPVRGYGICVTNQ